MTNETKTVEQLQAELRAAQEALAEVERKKAEEIREAKRAAERAKRDAEEAKITERVQKLLCPVYDALVAARPELGMIDVEALPRGIKLGRGDYPDRDLQIRVEREEASGNRYSLYTLYTGRLVLTVGDTYQDFPKVRYPQRKDGSFNVEKIVVTVKERVAAKAAKLQREQEKARAAESATELAARVSRDLGYVDKYSNPISGTVTHSRQRGGHGSGYEYWTSEAPAGRVYYSVGTLTVTPEQARVLRDALLQIKVIEPKKEKQS